MWPFWCRDGAEAVCAPRAEGWCCCKGAQEEVGGCGGGSWWLAVVGR
jgi:hypothetical protein